MSRHQSELEMASMRRRRSRSATSQNTCTSFVSAPVSFALLLLALITLSVLSSASAERTVGTYKTLEECKALGFDPFQLACDTCKLLPASAQSSCEACCQPYKSIENQRTHRYAGAVLFHSDGGGLSSEVSTFLEEDLENVHSQKGKSRLQLLELSGGGSLFHRQPSGIFFFDDIPSSLQDFRKLQQEAKEIIIVDGWKRDDIRDMILALLPDK